jgi:hypothetical protein
MAETTAKTPKIVSVTEDPARWIEVWAKTEDVAMHFNEMIMNYRLKAIAGVGVAAGLVGSVLIAYYQRLLLGAVDEAKRLEGETGEAVQLSVKIEPRAKRSWYAVSGWAFYALPLAAMLVICGHAFCRAHR